MALVSLASKGMKVIFLMVKKGEKIVKVVSVAVQNKVRLVIKVMVKSVKPNVITVRNFAILKDFVG